MSFDASRRVAVGLVLTLLASGLLAPLASAAPGADATLIDCPLLPLTTAVQCWEINAAILRDQAEAFLYDLTTQVYQYVKCGIIGPPFC